MTKYIKSDFLTEASVDADGELTNNIKNRSEKKMKSENFNCIRRH